MRIVALFSLMIIMISSVGYYFWKNPSSPVKVNNISVVKSNSGNTVLLIRLKKKVENLKQYLQERHFNTDICFLIDMEINSGKNRFFVYNLKKDSIELAGLVTHGSGLANDGNRIEFSNVSGSNCTSLGRYRIGKAYNGKFGLAYKLMGMDDTNSKAFERFVVLHAHSCVPNVEVYPSTICESWGCPTVSPAFLQKLKKYINNAEKPILLEIYK